MSRPDPARMALLGAIADANDRVEASTHAVIRFVIGAGWNAEKTRHHRNALAAALVDLEVAKRALVELDKLDTECGK